MYSFQNDYAEGAHPKVLQKLKETNFVQQIGYGEDEYSLKAKALIRKRIAQEDAEIYFVSGGTQANLLVISGLLKPHEAVICAETGHIAGHEAGSIEAVGHKVITLPSENGKLNPEMISQKLQDFQMRPHVVKPAMVYISNSTEIGTIYLKSELEQLSEFCKAQGLLLFMDGARLGPALMAADNDLLLTECAALTDVFYLGGTKNGALLGEAIIFGNSEKAFEFDYNLKQKGALLAKGRTLGIQFLALLEDNLYDELANHANRMAQELAKGIKNEGFDFLVPSTTNQIFPIFPENVIHKLRESFLFHEWLPIDEHYTAVRLVTSWATKTAAVQQFLTTLKAF